MQNLCGKTELEIKEMLRVIRKICYSNCCDECPFCKKDNGVCVINGVTPTDWVIGDDSGPWKAFN